MIQFNKDFLGYEPNSVVKYLSSDNEERFHQNRKRQPDDWYYLANEIAYELNSLGHRSKNIEDIDLDNYILFTGCSNTLGVGLELEKTFPYLVAEGLQIDYYNLALSGTGIDVMLHNLIVWINTVKKPPKALMILWPHEVRFSILSAEDILAFHLPLGSHGAMLKVVSNDITRFMAAGDTIDYFKSRKKLSSILINNCYSESNILDIEQRELVGLDLARDMTHCGIISNGFLAKKILNKLN